MGRKNQFIEGEYYLIHHEGVDNKIVFADDEDYLRFIGLMYLCNSGEPIHHSDYRKATLEHLFQIPKSTSLIGVGAYTLLPNQFRILVHESSEGGVSKFMQKLLTGYTMYFNFKNGRKGQLFAGKFKADLLPNDVDLLRAFTNTHMLPLAMIKHSAIKGKQGHEAHRDHLIKFPYSSLPDYLGTTRPQGKLLTPTAFPDYFEEIKAHLDTALNDWVQQGESLQSVLVRR